MIINFIIFLFLKQPQSICTIEELSRVVISREDEISCNVSVFIEPDKLITFSMEDRDAQEFAIVLAGYYRLIAGELNIFSPQSFSWKSSLSEFL